MPFTLGLLLVALDLGLFLPSKRRSSHRHHLEPAQNRHMLVALTAYNDEESIGDAVNDFLAHPLVARVIDADNNSRDRTADCAHNAGARVVTEAEPGYVDAFTVAFRRLCWSRTWLLLRSVKAT